MAKKKAQTKRAFTAKDRAVLEALGGAIQARRKILDISQEELAHRAGLHPAYVGGVERGERNLALRNMAKLSAALETTLADIFKAAGL